MTAHRRFPTRMMLLGAGAILLVAVHGIVLRLVTSHLGLRASMLTGVVALVLLAHVGLKRKR